MHRPFARLVLLGATLSVASSCDAVGNDIACGERAAVEGAKKLDRAYLTQLYAYAASGECKDMCRPPILSRLSGLGNRSPVFEVLPNRQARIKLSVCMEDGVMLFFKHIGASDASLYVMWSADFPKWEQALLWVAGQPDHGA